MYRRIGHTHRRLGRHACLFRPFDGRNDVTRVIQTAEDTCDIHALRMFYLIHQLTHIRGNGVHTQRVQTAVQHMGLDACLVKRLGKRTYCLIGVFTVQQVYLLTCAAIRLHAVETPHVNDDRRHARQLIFTGDILTATLPHVAVNQRKLNLFFTHIMCYFLAHN